MKRYLSTIGILLTFQMMCLSQGNESFKYIWAKGGMNLRQHPKVTSKIISKVPYGDSLIILNTTSIGLANLLMKAGEKRRRLLLQSHWVEVVVNNVRGYMIDGFLLDYPCPKKNESLTNYLDRMEIKNKDKNKEKSFKMEFGIARFEYLNSPMLASGS
ncbi:MAG: hypothetical protein ACJATI_002776 [Halioglobus sp.]|jgi:hypothetical protein